MQTEGTASVADLEQRIAELQEENTQLKETVDGLRTALKYVVKEALGVFEATERQTEAGKMRLERTLDRSFTNTTLIKELIE